jgi:hypothetical protein
MDPDIGCCEAAAAPEISPFQDYCPLESGKRKLRKLFILGERKIEISSASKKKQRQTIQSVS